MSLSQQGAPDHGTLTLVYASLNAERCRAASVPHNRNRVLHQNGGGRSGGTSLFCPCRRDRRVNDIRAVQAAGRGDHLSVPAKDRREALAAPPPPLGHTPPGAGDA